MGLWTLEIEERRNRADLLEIFKQIKGFTAYKVVGRPPIYSIVCVGTIWLAGNNYSLIAGTYKWHHALC